MREYQATFRHCDVEGRRGWEQVRRMYGLIATQYVDYSALLVLTRLRAIERRCG